MNSLRSKALVLVAALGAVSASYAVAAPSATVIEIKTATSTGTFELNQIASATMRSDSTILNMVSGMRYAFETKPQAWSFYSLNAPTLGRQTAEIEDVAAQPVALQNQVQFSAQGSNLQVQSLLPARYQLFTVTGQLLAQSNDFATEWSTAITATSAMVLRVSTAEKTQSFLVQPK